MLDQRESGRRGETTLLPRRGCASTGMCEQRSPSRDMPQDPSDEPAGEMLERIRADKENGAATAEVNRR